jgi:hypothetical protein
MNTFTISLNTLALNGKTIQVPELPVATNATVQTFIIQQLSRCFSGRANTAVQNAKTKGRECPDNGLAEALAWLSNGLQGKVPVRTRESSSSTPKSREDLREIAERNVETRIARAIVANRNARGASEKVSEYNKRIEALLRTHGDQPLYNLASRTLAAHCRAKGIELPQGKDHNRQIAAWIAKRGFTDEAVAAELDTLCLKHGLIDADLDDFDFEVEVAD